MPEVSALCQKGRHDAASLRTRFALTHCNGMARDLVPRGPMGMRYVDHPCRCPCHKAAASTPA